MIAEDGSQLVGDTTAPWCDDGLGDVFPREPPLLRTTHHVRNLLEVHIEVIITILGYVANYW